MVYLFLIVKKVMDFQVLKLKDETQSIATTDDNNEQPLFYEIYLFYEF